VSSSTAAFLGLLRFKLPVILLDDLSTASLAGCTRALTPYVRRPINLVRLASFLSLPSLAWTDLSRFRVTEWSSLRFMYIALESNQPSIPQNGIAPPWDLL
jgi:hypothetical protein